MGAVQVQSSPAIPRPETQPDPQWPDPSSSSTVLGVLKEMIRSL